MKALILQRVIPEYRVAVFRDITRNENFDISLIIGHSIEGSKAKNSNDLSGIRFIQLPTKCVSMFGRLFTWHVGLLRAIKEARPEVIVCEAESHFLGYLTAIVYKILLSPQTRLLLWCFYSLPGVEHERSLLHLWVKKNARHFFDGFISYTSYGKAKLISSGISPDKITVAVNVCDTESLVCKDASLLISKDDSKKTFGVEGKFVVTYVGTVDEAKKPEVIIDLADRFREKNFHFFLIGSGPLEESLRSRVIELGLHNITVTGRIVEDLPRYYRATDIVVIPGRGGIVISESMCFGVPVLVHQADGVEYDLVRQGETGVILRSGELTEFESELTALSESPDKVRKMGECARQLINDKFNTKSMAGAVIGSIETIYLNR